MEKKKRKTLFHYGTYLTVTNGSMLEGDNSVSRR